MEKEKVCIECNKQYNNPGRLCNSCRSKRWKANNRERDLEQRRNYNKKYKAAHRPKPIRKHCKFCDKVFTCNTRTPNQMFCGDTCRRKMYRKEKRDQINEYRKQYNIDHPKQKIESNKKYKNKTRFGGNKEKCFERDGYVCTNCGSEKMIVPHHIDGTGQTDHPNHELSNLITLCKPCHIKIHPPVKKS